MQYAAYEQPKASVMTTDTSRGERRLISVLMIATTLFAYSDTARILAEPPLDQFLMTGDVFKCCSLLARIILTRRIRHQLVFAFCEQNIAQQ